jgi:hypothetical protein
MPPQVPSDDGSRAPATIAARPANTAATPAAGGFGGGIPGATLPEPQSSRSSDGGGPSTLRVLQIAAGLSFVASLLVLAWPRLKRKGT